MPIIELQRRLVRTGAIRLGNRVQKKNRDGTPAVDRQGRPVMIPNKLDTFRITTPHREVAESAAELFGGQLMPWQGARGPEWEVITDRRELPVMVPSQVIDSNYEMWGPKIKTRFCDGQTERLRGVSCLCQRWDNHEHRYVGDKCMICNVSKTWKGDPHTHQYDMGECLVCGCRRPCKPTTRVNVMIQGTPGLGTFKIESHGINAAIELPTLSMMIEQAPRPLPAILGMRPEERRLLKRDGSIETRQFRVPELRFPWAVPELLFADRMQLEAASRSAIVTGPALAAIAAAPQPPVDEQPAEDDDDERNLTREDILALALSAKTVDDVRGLWVSARNAGVRDKGIERVLADRAAELATQEPEILDAEIIEED